MTTTPLNPSVLSHRLPGLLPAPAPTCAGNHIFLSFVVEVFETDTPVLVPGKRKLGLISLKKKKNGRKT
jgi:hypothetical protein